MPPKAQITIIGLGLIGTSLGLALKRAGGNFDIIGHDREPEAAARARKRGAVDQTSWNLIAAVENADVILLAIPISAMESTLQAIAGDLKEGCILMDTCTIKRPVLEWAERILPAHVSFIGGNPILYQLLPAAQGPEGASETLFDKSLFCLCPSSRAAPEAVQLVSEMVNALGAQPYFLDAEEHDGLIAGVELLPLATAGALMESAAHSPGWREITRLAGERFASATEMTVTDAETAASLLIHNADNLIRWVNILIQTLYQMRSALEDRDEGALRSLFEEALAQREKWLKERVVGALPEGAAPATEVPSYWQTLLGARLFRRSRSGKK